MRGSRCTVSDLSSSWYGATSAGRGHGGRNSEPRVWISTARDGRNEACSVGRICPAASNRDGRCRGRREGRWGQSFNTCRTGVSWEEGMTCSRYISNRSWRPGELRGDTGCDGACTCTSCLPGFEGTRERCTLDTKGGAHSMGFTRIGRHEPVLKTKFVGPERCLHSASR